MLPKKRSRTTPLIPGLANYLKTINPTIQKAMSQCALVQPDDPALWLSKFFLTQSPAGENYFMQRKIKNVSSIALATAASPSSLQNFKSSNAISSTKTVETTLSTLDIEALNNATKPSEGIHIKAALKPLGIWEKRLRIESGKVKDGSAQVQPETKETGIVAIADIMESSSQTAPNIRNRMTQTHLSSRDALVRLQKEAKVWVERRQRDITEDYAMKKWYEKVHSQTKLVATLRRLFLDLDTTGSRTLRSKDILKSISQDPSLQNQLMKAPPALRSLLNPKLWKKTFDKMDYKRKGFVTFLDWERFVHRTNNINTDGFDRFALLRALSWDEDVIKAISLCPQLKPLLHPKEFEKTFSKINQSKSGILTWPELRQFVDIKREEEIQNNEKEKREKAADKARLDLSNARDQVAETMKILKKIFHSIDKRSIYQGMH